MKQRTGLAVLLATAVLVSLSHIELQRADGGWLVLVDGRTVDAAGALEERWVALVRDCRPVQTQPPATPLQLRALEVLREYSPPDSRSAQIVRLQAQGDWLLARVRFAALEDAVVLLRDTREGLAVAPGGVWSGPTHPYSPGAMVRRYLRAQVPEAPRALMDCLDSED